MENMAVFEVAWHSMAFDSLFLHELNPTVSIRVERESASSLKCDVAALNSETILSLL
jgi:hypothetical protein